MHGAIAIAAGVFAVVSLFELGRVTAASASLTPTSGAGSILVVGSINADVVIPVEDLPKSGETLVAMDTEDSGTVIAGGKGANQAVCASRLGVSTAFSCMFGNDANAQMLENVMISNGVDTSHCNKCAKPSGLGLVFLQPSGIVSSIVVGASNLAWPQTVQFDDMLKPGCGIECVMLQMEVPQHVNDAVAKAACKAGVPVFQDMGGKYE
jgi:ribokinase